MQGYEAASYGEGIADVYDEWYQGITDVADTCAALEALALAGHPVLELGVGTGRLAVPLAERGVEVHGVDASPAMLARLAARDTHGRVRVVTGDMVDDLPDGPFGLVFVAYNTFFGLLTAERQQACLRAVAARMVPGGAFVIEAFVPEVQPVESVTVRSISVDRVVLSVSRADHDAQTAEGHFVELSERGGVRLRPWAVRWATPEQLDTGAGAAGLRLDQRWESFDGTPFTADSPRHVSVYRRIHTAVPPNPGAVS